MPPPRPRWRELLWWTGVSGGIALVLALCASALGDVAPEHETVMLLGPFESGKVRVVLWCLAALALGLAVVVPVTIVLLWPGTWWGDGLAVLLWIPALPVMGAVMLVAALFYDSQPETHRFTVDGHDYLVASQIGFLIAADDTYLSLYRKDGRLYRLVELRLPPADTARLESEGFSLDRREGEASLVYTDAGGGPVRVRIP